MKSILASLFCVILALGSGGCGTSRDRRNADDGGAGGSAGTDGAAGSGGFGGSGGSGGLDDGGAGGDAGAGGRGGQGGNEGEDERWIFIWSPDICIEICTEMRQGDTRNLRGEVRDANGDVIEGLVVDLSSDDESVITISANRVVRAINPGVAKIVGRADGLVGHLEFNVGLPLVARIDVSPKELTLPIGESRTVTALARDFSNKPLPSAELTWATTNPLVATVTEEGSVQAVGPGVAWIEVWASTGIPEHQGRVVLTVPSDQPRAKGMEMEAIAVGTGYACGLANGGMTYCWGSNFWGELGRGFRSPTTEAFPTPEGVIDGAPFVSITSSSSHSCALESTNIPWCWGSNGSGELGIDEEVGDTPNSPQPTRFADETIRFTKIGAGYNHSCGLTPDGTPMCWGANFSGELGIGDDRVEDKIAKPTPVALEVQAKDLAVGRSGSCALDVSGQAWCWGDNFQGTLGAGREIRSSRKPVKVAGDHVFASIRSNANHYCALTEAGKAWCWGENESGQLGTTTPDMRGFVPFAVDGDHTFLVIATGAHHSCAIDDAHDAWCWGANNDGQLGWGGVENGPTVRKVHGGLKFKAISASNNTSCALTIDDEAFCWGSNRNGHLGAGAAYVDGRSPVPWPVAGPTTTIQE